MQISENTPVTPPTKEAAQVATPQTQTKPTEKAESLTPRTASANAPKAATVQLSSAAQVRHLEQQGLTPAQIARKLNISVNTVNGYIGAGTNTATTTPKPNSPSEESTENPAKKAIETMLGS